MTRNSYTGIGSRKTPDDILLHMMELASELEKLGYILRSGAAQGADKAFEAGVKDSDNAEIYLPWRGFENHNTGSYSIMPEAFTIASVVHPAWNRLKQGGQKLHARNAHQVLGSNLLKPSEFVVCWTPNGKEIGGTRTAIKIAQLRSIPVYNLADRLWNIEDFMIRKLEK